MTPTRRDHTLTALTVEVDARETAALVDEWARREVPVPLTVIESPYRDVATLLLNYVAHVRRDSPRDVTCVYVPEYVVGHWWQQLLHNQSGLRLKGRLLFMPGVMVTSVPYHLAPASARERAGGVIGPTKTQI